LQLPHWSKGIRKKIMKMKKWKDIAGHRPGCAYKGVAVYGTDKEMAKYYSRYCPGCNIPVKWEEIQQEEEDTALKS
jgi:Na+-translocating ferredoxin:NAD+ oxidoreductase RNF subunit RnfB